MSKFKDQTESTLPLSSDENTGASAQPSEQSASSDNTKTFTPTLKNPSPSMLSSDKDGLTTVLTTPAITEKTRQHAMLAKVALRQLEKAGLIKRFKVLSKDGATIQKMRVEFDVSLWTENLELK